MFPHYTVVWYENGRGVTIGSGISFGFTFVFFSWPTYYYYRKNERLQESGKIDPLVSFDFLADPKAIEIQKSTPIEGSKWA